MSEGKQRFFVSHKEKSRTVTAVNLRETVLRSLLWVGGLRYGGQLITWIITIFIIRLLNPEDYGVIAKASVFLGFFMMLGESGLTAGIVHKRDLDNVHLHKLFGLLLVVNVFSMLLLFSLAPLIANLFHESRLVPILRVLSLNFILIAMSVIPQALLVRNMNFRLKSWVDLLGALGGAGVSLVLAVYGMAEWSLVWGALSAYLILAIGYNWINPILLLPTLDFRGIKYFISFGAFLTGSSILVYLYSNCDLVIGGRVLSNEELGLYSTAIALATLPMNKLAPVLSQVAFPAYSVIQKECHLVKSHFIKSIRLVSFLIFPLYWSGIFIVGDIFSLLFGEKWQGMTILFQVLCLIMPFRVLNSLYAPVLQGIGKAKEHFINTVIITFLIIPAFLILIRWSSFGLCIAWALGFSMAFLAISHRVISSVGVSKNEYVAAISTSVVAALTGMVFIYVWKRFCIWIEMSSLIFILSSIIIALSLYLTVIFIFDRKILMDLRSLRGDKYQTDTLRPSI